MPFESRTNTLSPGCRLEEYCIEKVLGAGSFGVTYKGLDTQLDAPVAIKEYFPAEWSYRDADTITVCPNTVGERCRVGSISGYEWGLERFLDEARTLAQIQHPSVVRVKRYLRAYNTAYIVMDYEEGQPLSKLLDPDQTLTEERIRSLLDDVLSALESVHQHHFLHRDIKPSNLYVRAGDQRVILIDFGAARMMWDDGAKSMTSVFTSGYSPLEQYGVHGDRCGKWTDIYALGAVLYRCIAGQTPTAAPDRWLVEMKPAIRVGAERYSANLLSVIDKALAMQVEQRFVDVAEMRTALAGERHTAITSPGTPTTSGRPESPVLNKPKGDAQPKMPPKGVAVALIALVVVVLWLWLSGSKEVVLRVEKPVPSEAPAAAKTDDGKGSTNTKPAVPTPSHTKCH